MAIAGTLCVRAATVDLEIRVRVLAGQDTGWAIAGVSSFDGSAGSILGCGDVCLGVGGLEVGLAFLEMLNLAGGVLCAHEAAVKTAHLIALAEGTVSVDVIPPYQEYPKT